MDKYQSRKPKTAHAIVDSLDDDIADEALDRDRVADRGTACSSQTRRVDRRLPPVR
jgi:hypothetical protein